MATTIPGKDAPFEARKAAIYALTWEKLPQGRRRLRTLLQFACDPSESTEIRKEALVGAAQFHSRRATHAVLPILQDRDAPWELRAEAAHVIGSAADRRRWVVRALMDVWKDAPPPVRFYLAYALASRRNRRAIPLLLQSADDPTPAPDLWWTLAQECRWAITVCRGVKTIDGPEDPALLSPTWEAHTSRLRARGRTVRRAV